MAFNFGGGGSLVKNWIITFGSGSDAILPLDENGGVAVDNWEFSRGVLGGARHGMDI